MAGLHALITRTRRRHAHRTKPPTLVQFERATKLGADRVPAFVNLSLRIRAGQHWVVLSQERTAYYTLLQCVAGLQQPDQGTIKIRGHVSWPLGQSVGLSNKLSCAENSRFLVGIYGQRGQRNRDLEMVRELTALSHEEWLSPLEKLPNKIKSRLRLALSLSCDFDLYVLDSTIIKRARQSTSWSDCWEELLRQRLQTRAVLSTGIYPLLEAHEAAKGLVLTQGRLAMKGTLMECQEYFCKDLQIIKSKRHQQRQS